jgi:hypothetical protein
MVIGGIRAPDILLYPEILAVSVEEVVLMNPIGGGGGRALTVEGAEPHLYKIS